MRTKLLVATWPDENGEKAMLADAALLESEFAPTSAGGDAACHIKALLTRVRELERALKATGYFQQHYTPPADPGEHDYFQDWKESVEYTEDVDAMLDGIVPTTRNGTSLWLKCRVQELINMNKSAADKLSDCWLLLDEIARNAPKMTSVRAACENLLKKQQCPGWKE